MENSTTKQINDMITDLNNLKRNLKNIKGESALNFMSTEIGKIANRVPQLIEESIYMK